VEESSRGALLDGNRTRRRIDLGPEREGKWTRAPGEDVEVYVKAMSIIESVYLHEHRAFKDDFKVHDHTLHHTLQRIWVSRSLHGSRL
jgi:hypothetical protein